MQVVSSAHLAAERGHASIVEKLLLAGYMPDTPLGAGASGSRAQAPAAPGQHGQRGSPAHPTSLAGAVGDQGGLERGPAAIAEEAAPGGESPPGTSSGNVSSHGSSGQEVGGLPRDVPGMSHELNEGGDFAGATALHLAAAGGHLDVSTCILFE